MKISKKSMPDRVTIVAKTTNKGTKPSFYRWWEAKDDVKLANELCSTVLYLKEGQGFRQRQAAIFARLYGNQSLFGFVGSNLSKMDQYAGLPPDRPTFNIISSVTDTLVSKLTQSRPSPVFLTNNGDYKERNLAKQLNNFINGEFYRTKAYDVMEYVLRDALVEGTGCLKVYENDKKEVAIERVFLTELFVDLSESYMGDPRSLYQVKLIDREVLETSFPKVSKKIILEAEASTLDNSAESSKTISDLVLVVEGWHLPSGPGSGDGRHTIACSTGVILDEEYTKDTFPFIFLHHKKRTFGFWSQGVAETLMGTQIEINSLLNTISRAIKLVGVPRVFIEDGSKVVKAHQNNEVGVIVTYRGTKPSYEVAPCVPQEMYAERDRLIQYGYRQEGLSEMAANSEKPAGLDSGEAIRTYDDINTDRFAALSRRYDNVFIDLAYQITDKARDIAKRDGKYSTVFPDKTGSKEVDLPKASLLNDSYVIQCFNESSLPKNPAGRQQAIVERVQAGILSIKEGRRLMDYPDLAQIETLANASEERIFMILDEIVEKGKYTEPDPFMDLALAEQLVVQYYNLYSCRKLEESKCQMLRDFFSQIQLLKQAGTPPVQPQPMAPSAEPQMPQAPTQAI